MKRKLKLIFLLCIAFLAGFFYTALVYFGIIHKIRAGFAFYPWYVHLIFVLIFLHVTIAVHELGHFFSLRKQGIEVKAIYIMMFTWVKQGKHWKFKLLPKFALMIGGLVMPVISNLSSDEAFDELKIKLGKSIHAGPKTSLYYGIATTLFFIVTLCFNQGALTGIALTLAMVNGILTVLVMISSNHSAQGLYGDFVASKQLKQNELFATTYMLSGHEVSKTSNINGDYLWPKIILLLERYPINYNDQSATLAQFYLEEVIYKKRIGCTSIDDKVLLFLNRVPQNETEMIIWFYALYYEAFYVSKSQAIRRFNDLNLETLKVKAKVKTYWICTTEHLFSMKDHRLYFESLKYDISTSTAWILRPLEQKYHTYQEILQISAHLSVENKENKHQHDIINVR